MIQNVKWKSFKIINYKWQNITNVNRLKIIDDLKRQITNVINQNMIQNQKGLIIANEKKLLITNENYISWQSTNDKGYKMIMSIFKWYLQITNTTNDIGITIRNEKTITMTIYKLLKTYIDKWQPKT